MWRHSGGLYYHATAAPSLVGSTTYRPRESEGASLLNTLLYAQSVVERIKEPGLFSALYGRVVMPWQVFCDNYHAGVIGLRL